MDQTPYRADKYIVTRTDGKPVGSTFVIEIERDPQAEQLLIAIAAVYLHERYELAQSLIDLARDKFNAELEAEHKGVKP